MYFFAKAIALSSSRGISPIGKDLLVTKCDIWSCSMDHSHMETIKFPTFCSQQASMCRPLPPAGRPLNRLWTNDCRPMIKFQSIGKYRPLDRQTGDWSMTSLALWPSASVLTPVFVRFPEITYHISRSWLSIPRLHSGWQSKAFSEKRLEGYTKAPREARSARGVNARLR